MGSLLETEDYVRETTEGSLDTPISERSFRLKLLASEDERHLLQDQIFILQDQVRESHKRFQRCKEEVSMNAQGLRKCVQEREVAVLRCAGLEKYCAKLERECRLYEHDLMKALESYDELEKKNNELRSQLNDNFSLQDEAKSLQEDKENLLINLQRAEEEVKVLSEDNRLLDEENKRLLRRLQLERQSHESGCKLSASGSSVKGKRRSIFGKQNPKEENEFGLEEQLRQALSPLHQNFPESRILMS